MSEEDQVHVRGHKRGKRGPQVMKVDVGDEFYHFRLRSPYRLRARGYTRTRTIKARGSSLPGLTSDQKQFAKGQDGQVVYFFRGRKTNGGEGRPQSILIPRRKRQAG